MSWDWFENGGQIAAGESPTLSFTTNGSPHQVYLLVTDDAGATSNSYDLVVISVVQQIGCVKGDFDANGFVDAGDLNLLGLNWQGSIAAAASAASVPEPGTLFSTLMLIVGVAVWGGRRR